METEAQLIVLRASLRWLAQQHPSWTHQELARALGKSLAWVKKWLKRLHEAAPGDVMALPTECATSFNSSGIRLESILSDSPASRRQSYF